jgi:DNA-binding response OmpR family regulator
MKTINTIDPIRILLIEDNPGDAQIVKALLEEFREISVDHADNLKDGMNMLMNGNYKLI